MARKTTAPAPVAPDAPAAPATLSAALEEIFARMGPDDLMGLYEAMTLRLGVEPPKGKSGKSGAKARKLPTWAKNRAQADTGAAAKLAHREAKDAFRAARTPETWAVYSRAYDAYNAIRPGLLQAKLRAPGADGATTAGASGVMAPTGKGVLKPVPTAATAKPTPVREVKAASAPRKSPLATQVENAINAALPEARTLKSALIRAEAKITSTRQPEGIKAKAVAMIREWLTPEAWAAYQAAR